MRRIAAPVCAVLLSLVGCSSSAAVSAPARTTAAGGSTTTTVSGAVTSMPRLHARVVGRLADPVSRAVAVEMGSRIVVLGGLTTGDVTTGRVVAVDPNNWTSVADGELREAVHDASGAALGGHAVVFGGGSSSEVANTQWWTDGTSRIVGTLPGPRSDSAATTVGITAYVVGGFNGTGMDRAVVATTTGRTFRTVAHLKQGVRYPAVASLSGKVYVFGGELATTDGTSTGAQSRLVQQIDPKTGQTRILGKLPWGIGHAMAFALGGRLYLAGGRRGTQATSRVWAVNPTNARLTAVGRLPQAISDSAVASHGTRSVVLIGGETSGPYEPQRIIVVVSLR
jgi:hypothetical protein